jgi:hypothetical protein
MLQSLRSKLFTADHAEQATGLDGAGLLEAIVCETHAAALLVAAIASGLNALQGKAPLRNPAELKSFLPSSSTIVGELLRSHEEAGLGDIALLRMKEFLGDLAAARTGIERLFADFDRLGVQHAVSHGAAALTAWSRLCQRAIGAVSALDADLRDRLPPYYGENSAMLLRILKSAGDGQCPCIDKAGNVVLPDMPQRRKAARRSLLQQCVLRHRGKTATVIAKDISTTGLGLERTPELKTNELVQVELTGGRRLIGVVVWASRTSAGVKLGKPLPPNDPLLAG